MPRLALGWLNHYSYRFLPTFLQNVAFLVFLQFQKKKKELFPFF